MIRIKICGITNLDDAMAAVEAGADALGFNFAPEAKAKERYIDPDEAYRIVEALPPFVTSAAVCVNESLDRVREYLGFMDVAQLHGEESPEMANAVGHRAIKAFSAGERFQPESMLAYRVSGYLLDASLPGQRGGTGVTCDWVTARRATELERPIILAGGLTPDNVAEAVQAVKPYGVDTAGGVESAPGKKDHERTRAFIRNARLSLPGQ